VASKHKALQTKVATQAAEALKQVVEHQKGSAEQNKFLLTSKKKVSAAA
jgi:hypothetical protein